MAIINSTKLFQSKILETAFLVTMALGLLAGYKLIDSLVLFKKFNGEKLVKTISFELIYALLSFFVGVVSTLVLILLFK